MNDDLISREWLEDAFDNLCCHDCKKCRNFRIEDSFYKCGLIENARAVAVICKVCDGYEAGYSAGLKDVERPQDDPMKIVADKLPFHECADSDCIEASKGNCAVCEFRCVTKEEIDNAPTVEPNWKFYFDHGYAQAKKDLKMALDKQMNFEENCRESVFEIIDNATPVCGNNPKWCESCVSKGKCASTRPQGGFDYKVINRGKCILCGKELTEGLFFCKECKEE